MAYNGAGVFVINSAGQPVVAGTTIDETVFNTLTADLASGLSTCMLKDGTQTVTANVPMAGYKFTGIGLGTSATDSARVDNANSYATCEFRLSLTTAVPVTTSDVTAATTIYCVPYKGNRIALYDGTNWHMRNSAEFSLALGTLTSGKPYDVFCYDNAGTPTLEFLVWTNDTTRATALTTQDGVLCKTGAVTRRYLGTFYTTSTTQTEDSLAKRYLWNYYNRIPRSMSVLVTGGGWGYTTATWRQANASATNQLNYIVGVQEDPVSANVSVIANNATLCSIAVGIGVDSTTVPSGRTIWATCAASSSSYTGVRADYSGFPGVGKHLLAWLEISVAVGSTSWIQTTWDGTATASGILGTVMG